MAKLRTEPEQQAYERRMRLLYEQLRTNGDPFAREGAGISRESASTQNSARITQSKGSEEAAAQRNPTTANLRDLASAF
jgi:hypothetical protein